MSARASRLGASLDVLVAAGVLGYYQRRGGMERPWLLCGRELGGAFNDRAYTTREAEAFALGASAALALGKEVAA